MDGMSISGMVGTLAGDDTALLVMKDAEMARGFCEDIQHGADEGLRRAGANQVPAGPLAQYGPHGINDGQQLLDEEQHGAYLDSFGRVEVELEAYAACRRRRPRR
mgnify:CR=1 FL=1